MRAIHRRSITRGSATRRSTSLRRNREEASLGSFCDPPEFTSRSDVDRPRLYSGKNRRPSIRKDERRDGNRFYHSEVDAKESAWQLSTIDPSTSLGMTKYSHCAIHFSADGKEGSKNGWPTFALTSYGVARSDRDQALSRSCPAKPLDRISTGDTLILMSSADSIESLEREPEFLGFSFFLIQSNRGIIGATSGEESVLDIRMRGVQFPLAPLWALEVPDEALRLWGQAQIRFAKLSQTPENLVRHFLVFGEKSRKG